MLNVKDLNLSFGAQTIFDNISFNVNHDQRIGLVGRNGSGKTTLLKVIAGRHGLDSGQISVQKDCKIAYMPQDVVLLSDKTVLQEAVDTFGDLGQLADELEKLEKELDNASDLEDHDKVERYAHIQHKLLEHDYEEKKSKTKKILDGLGFKPEQLDHAVSELSVGWKMRLVLAKLLLQKADFYLFDEPTNHLDMLAKDWFLDFLKSSQFGFMIVCHDRYFLDHLCDQIFEISRGRLRQYRGNYTKYVQLKEVDEQLLEKKYIEQQKYIKQQKATIERFRASATKAKMAQSMIKALDKIDLIELEHKQKTVRFNFSNIKRSGKIVLDVKDLGFSFGDKKIFQNVSFQVERGQKIAIVAPNGMGKTTLLNVVNGKYKANNGSVEFGYHVEPVVFEQDQNRSLDLKKSILDEVENSCKTSEARTKVRATLGAFLFPGEAVDKKIRVLSGGEKNRVAMVKVLLQDANLLILDEPTNHLDIESKDVLLNVLKQFTGTILFVSHDRDFLNHLATHIIDLTVSGAKFYSGNYDSYLYQKNTQESGLSGSQIDLKKDKNYNCKTKKSNKELYQDRKKVKNLESKIARLEKELVRLTKQFEVLEYGTDDYNKTHTRFQEVEQQIESSLKLWEKLND